MSVDGFIQPLGQEDKPITDVLQSMLGHVDLASRRWVYEQYDSHVMADTIAGPGGDAALVRVHGSQRGLAITTDCTPRYVEADPETGGNKPLQKPIEIFVPLVRARLQSPII